MPFVVAYWDCWTGQLDYWARRSFNDRLTGFYAAAFSANLEVRTNNGGKDIIFVASEYALASPDVEGSTKPAEFITVAQEQQAIAAMSNVSEKYPMLVCAGSMPVRENGGPPSNARNTCYAYHNGNRLWTINKHHGVGETGGDPQLVFTPGTGYGTATINGVSYGAEICRDATIGMLPVVVDRRICVSAGAGKATLNGYANETLIIAERGSEEHGVWNYRGSPTGAKIEPYKVEKIIAGTIKYYLVP